MRRQLAHCGGSEKKYDAESTEGRVAERLGGTSEKNVEAQLALGITTLLTLVALQLYLSAYLFVIASLAVIATTTWSRAARLNRRFFFGLSAAYALVLALLFGTGI